MPHKNPAPGNNSGLTKYMLLIGETPVLTKDEWWEQAREWSKKLELNNHQMRLIFRANGNAVPDQASAHAALWEVLSQYADILDTWLGQVQASGIIPLKRVVNREKGGAQ